MWKARLWTVPRRRIRVNKNLKALIATAVCIIGITIIYRVLFIRTVNYNIAGIDVPAKYDILTHKAVPITNYNGKPIKRTVVDNNTNKIGFDSSGITAAHFRWQLFTGWVNSHPEYKGWESDPEIFKRANEDFRKNVQVDVKVLK
jgi:hypothetical protein